MLDFRGYGIRDFLGWVQMYSIGVRVEYCLFQASVIEWGLRLSGKMATVISWGERGDNPAHVSWQLPLLQLSPTPSTPVLPQVTPV